MGEFDVLIGRTITAVEYHREDEGRPTYDVLTLTFADGGSVEFSSSDYEGYESWLTMVDPAA